MTENYSILAVDDDLDVLGTLSRALAREGYQVQTSNSGQEAFDKLIDSQNPDLIILDVMMPGQSGIELCKRIRANPNFNAIPILFLTARSQTQDVVIGLDAGGDDYVTKPFEVHELQARVRALLRRVERDTVRQSTQLQIGELELDSSTYRATMNDEMIQLTSTEHRLLRYIMEHPNQALSPSHLLEAVWGYPADAGDPDLVRAHIRNLRSKLTVLDTEYDFIKTIHGVGYMIND